MKPDGYNKKRETAAAYEKEQSKQGRDIGTLPPVEDWPRRKEAERDFQLFCEFYFPELFSIKWCHDHLKVISAIERAVLYGGLFAMAMPRGSGKTTLSEIACLWATLYGHRAFVCLIGSDEASASTMLDSLKIELECNDLLLEDFPEVCFPIRALEGIPHRCGGQLYRGERTHIGWVAKELVLPTIEGSTASGAIIKVAGITGRIRGMKFKRADGKSVRPSLVVIDDPQTDESARSASQCETRESTLSGAILNLAGPGQKIAGIMPCTVIRPDDMADKMLNPEEYPEWQGIRTKMVYEFPTNELLWEEYSRIRSEDLQTDGDGSKGTDFYRQNRVAMDAGSKVAWAERYNHDELSALQHAMNLKMRDENAFFSEYQNEPIHEVAGDVLHLTPDQVASKLHGLGHGVPSVGVAYLTAFVDVHDACLYWMVCGWSRQFDGWVVDYGTTPRQTKRYFTLRQVTTTLKQLSPSSGTEGAIYAGLEHIVNELCAKEWVREDGIVMRVERLHVDAGYKTSTVHQFCRQSPHAAILRPQRGEGITAGRKPISQYDRTRGDFVGHFWWIPTGKGRALRTIHADVNYWKSFCRDRFATTFGDKGCLSIFGSKPHDHKLLADHITSETAIKTEGHGRVVEEWNLLPARDNHWLDCLVGCTVAASMLGSVLYTSEDKQEPVRKKIPLSELQARKRNGKGNGNA